jgi:hypothetical protein
MIDLSLDALATFRISRLVTSDVLFDDQRARLHLWLEAEGHDKLAWLIQCPWCVSPYVAAGVIVARQVAPRAWSPLARALAFSAVAGLLSEH